MIDISNRPLPDPDNISSHYWKAAADGRLTYQECPACGHRQLYPRALCTVCAADPEWRDASGRGTVHTFTIIRQNHAKAFKEALPYVVAIVELDEGPRLMGNVIDCDPESVTIGMAVEVVMAPVDDDVAVPFWRPAG
jgi:uncharacterized OB-fold protein